MELLTPKFLFSIISDPVAMQILLSVSPQTFSKYQLLPSSISLRHFFIHARRETTL